MKLRRRQRTRLDPSLLRLPLVALVDVVFFLLFYFIIAGNIDLEENELAARLALLGASGDPAATVVNEATVLAVSDDVLGPSYRLGGREFRDRRELIATLRGMEKDAGVVIRSSPAIAFEVVAGALQAAHDAGFEKVTYLPTE